MLKGPRNYIYDTVYSGVKQSFPFLITKIQISLNVSSYFTKVSYVMYVKCINFLPQDSINTHFSGLHFQSISITILMQRHLADHSIYRAKRKVYFFLKMSLYLSFHKELFHNI